MEEKSQVRRAESAVEVIFESVLRKCGKSVEVLRDDVVESERGDTGESI